MRGSVQALHSRRWLWGSERFEQWERGSQCEKQQSSLGDFAKLVWWEGEIWV